jgi:hypothetical protein
MAARFAGFLADAGATWWQMLPVGPVHLDGSPYSSDSAFAGSPLLLSLESLAEEGLLTRGESVPPRLRADRVAYPAVMRFKLSRLRTAFARQEGTVVQRISSGVGLPMPVVDLEDREAEARGELLPQRLGQGRHVLERRRPLLVEPVEDLDGPVRPLAHPLQLGPQLRERQVG